jgi:hypothetical protein
VSVPVPDPVALSRYCLGGIGLARPRAWHADVDARLQMSGEDGRSILRRLARDPAASDG